MNRMNEKYTILTWQIFIFVLIIFVWEILGHINDKIYFILGTPSSVGKELYGLLFYDKLSWHFIVTGTESFIGLVLGTSLGSVLGLLLWYSDITAKIIRPYILIIGSLPVFAFAPLLIVWFGIGFWMKVVLATFSTFFIAFSQAYKGATSENKKYQELLLGMNATRKQIFKILIVPGALDWVFASMRLNIGFSLIGAFMGEFITANQGLGYVILRASSLYNVPRALAAGIGIIILAIIMDWGGSIIEKKRSLIIQLISVYYKLWKL